MVVSMGWSGGNTQICSVFKLDYYTIVLPLSHFIFPNITSSSVSSDNCLIVRGKSKNLLKVRILQSIVPQIEIQNKKNSTDGIIEKIVKFMENVLLTNFSTIPYQI